MRSQTNVNASILRRLGPLLEHSERVYKSRGKSGLISFFKVVRSNVLNYFSGNPHRVPGVRLRSSGLPVCLGGLAIDIEQGKLTSLELRFLLTVLFSSRALKEEPKPSIEPIISPLKKGADLSGLDRYAKDFWKDLGYQHNKVIPRKLK